jgi:hypothetical protein
LPCAAPMSPSPPPRSAAHTAYRRTDTRAAEGISQLEAGSEDVQITCLILYWFGFSLRIDLQHSGAVQFSSRFSR